MAYGLGNPAAMAIDGLRCLLIPVVLVGDLRDKARQALHAFCQVDVSEERL